MKRTLASLAPLLLLGTSAHAVVWADDITEATVLGFGADPRFVGVGFTGSGGTATFIGNGNGKAWIVTADHVIEQNQSTSFTLPNIGSFNAVGRLSFIDTGGFDLTVAEITNPGTAFASLYAPRLNLGAISAGTNIISAGYGGHASQNQRATTGQLTYDDERRGFQSVVHAFDPNDPTGLEDRFDAPGNPNKRAIEGFGAPGDSGSPFMRESDGAILGVLSGGQVEVYGGMNYYSPLTASLSTRIYSFTGIPAAPVPEPATLAALGLGAMALLRRNRRRRG